MQAIYVQAGRVLEYTPGAAVEVGAVVVVGSRVGIAVAPIAAGKPGDLTFEGVFEIVKEAGAVAKDQEVWWRPAGDPVNGTADSGAASVVGGSAYIGHAVKAAGANDETVFVRLQPRTPHPLEHRIADPGNAGAIPVVQSGSVQIVTAGAETRTLAVPTFVGQQLAISMKTDGGDCVITVAAAINQTGNNTITLNDAADFILLSAIQSGNNYRWKVTANDGGSLTTV